MKGSKTWISAYFSPTGTTASVVRAVAAGAGVQTIEWNMTIPKTSLKIEKNTVLLAAVPVYGGRIPSPAAERLSQLNGNGSYAVAIVVYGNRDFDDSLLELKDILEQQGFQVAAAGAFIAEHSIIRSIAAGRPDKNDLAIAHQFGADIEKLLSESKNFSSISVPGNIPYRGGGSSSVHPTAGDRCTRCGLCAKNCPVEAIPLENPNLTDTDKCITCMRCVTICPENARTLPAQFLTGAEEMLKKSAGERKEPQLFFASADKNKETEAAK